MKQKQEQQKIQLKEALECVTFENAHLAAELLIKDRGVNIAEALLLELEAQLYTNVYMPSMEKEKLQWQNKLS
jgi:hypothetical protein